MPTTKVTNTVLADNAALNNLNAGASIAFTKPVSVSGNFTVDTNTFFVDSVNNRVGIGTTSPTAGYSLDVTGAIRSTGNLLLQGNIVYLNSQQALTQGTNSLTLGAATYFTSLSYGNASTTQHTFNGSGITAATASFTSTTRPTSAGTGTPAATSLITRADGDERYPQKIVRKLVGSIALTSATASTVSGMSDLPLDADSLYEVTVYAILSTSTGGSFESFLLLSGTAFENFSGAQAGSGVLRANGILAGPYFYTATSVSPLYFTGNVTNNMCFGKAIFKTNSNAGTCKLDLAQRPSAVAGTTTVQSLVLSIQKIG